MLVVPGPGPGSPADPTGNSGQEPASTPDPATGAVPEPVRIAVPGGGLVPLLDADGTRVDAVPPTVGDGVLLDEQPDGTVVLVALTERRTAMVRDGSDRTSHAQVLAANVDVVLVVEHLDPEPSLGRIERLLMLAWRSGAQPVVVLTKADLVPDPAGMADEVRQVAIGADVHAVSVTAGSGMEPVRALLAPGRTLVVVGPSGAGKSTLVNALAGTMRWRRGSGGRPTARGAIRRCTGSSSRCREGRVSSTPRGYGGSDWSRTPMRWRRRSRT